MANQKINIFELDIDIDAAIKSTAQLRDQTDMLKLKYDSLRNSSSSSTEEIIRAKGAYDAANKEYRVAQREIEKLTSIEGKNVATIEQARNALSVVSSQWAKQAQLYGANSKEADALAKKKLELTDRLKELEKATGDNTRNVGNYTDSMKSAIMESGIFQQAQQKLNAVSQVTAPVLNAVKSQVREVSVSFKAARTTAQGYSGAQKAAAGATNLTSTALKLLKIALISTGIGAIVVLLGSLVAWFSKTQTGIDLVNTVLAGLGAAFDVIIDRVAKFGGAIIKLLSGDWSGGLQDMEDSFKGVGDEMMREIELAIKLEQVLQRVERAEINLDIRRAAANSRLKELKLLTDDTTKSTEERIAAAKEFQKIETDLTAEQVANQEKKVAALLGFAEVTDEVREQIKKIGQEGVTLDQLGLSESTVEDMKEFRDEATKLYDLQAQSYERQTENQNKLNSMVKEQQAKEAAAAKERIEAAKKATDAAIQESETRLKIFIAENEGKAKTLEDSLEFEKSIRDKELKNLEQKLKAGKLTRSEYELAVLEEKNAFLEKQNDLTVEYAQKEFELFKQQHQSRIDNNQMLTDAIVSEEQKRLDLIAEKQREFEKERFEQGVISQQDYNAAIDAINEENRIAKEEQATALKQQQDEAAAIDLENRMAVEEENFLAKMELQKERLEMQKAQELAAAEKTGADKTLIESKYAEQQKQIEEAKQAFKVEIASQTFGNLAELLGKESAAGKAMAVAQTTIDTYKAAQAAYAAMAGIPIIGPALGIAAAGAAVASGLKTVGKIMSTKKPSIPKAEKGITLGGRSHAEGGNRLYDEYGNPLVEAERGENVYVLNKRASGLINSLSYLNQATGGIPLSQATTYAAAGGMIANTPGVRNINSGASVDYDLFAMKMAEANSQLPPPVLALEDFNYKYNKNARVVNGASF